MALTKIKSGGLSDDLTIEFDSLSGTGAVAVTNILDEDNLVSNSATALATQQSIKAYVDTTVGATNEVVEDTTPQLGGDLDLNSHNITGTGTVDGRDVGTDGTKLDTVETNADVTDTANVTSAGALMDSELTAIASVKALNQGLATGNSPTFVAITGGSYNVGGTAVIDSGRNLVNMGNVNGAAGNFGSLAVDNFTLNGTTLALSSGDMTLDSASSINLNADNGNIVLQDGAVTTAMFQQTSSNFIIRSLVSDKDIIFQGEDGAASVVALTLDMSDGGEAYFAKNIHATSAFLTKTNNDPNLTLITTDADANAGPLLVLDRNSASPADGDVLGQIAFNGKNDAAEAHNYAKIEARIVDASNATEDGRLELMTSVATEEGISRILMNATETVVNDNSKDLNFRVESDGNANMFHVDAGSNGVGIGTTGNGPTPLTVNGGTSTAATIQLGNHGDNAGIHGKYSLTIKADSTEAISNRSIEFKIGTHQAFYSNVAGTVFNEAGANADFRVESDANPHALYLDAGNEVLLIGNNGRNNAFVDNVYVGLQIGNPGVDNFGGHMFMSQTAPQNQWKDIVACHDNNATGVYFTIHGVRTGDQNRSYAATVRYAYSQTFTLMTVSQQNTVVEYRVTSGHVLQYRFTTAGPYFVNLTVMAAG